MQQLFQHEHYRVIMGDLSLSLYHNCKAMTATCKCLTFISLCYGYLYLACCRFVSSIKDYMDIFLIFLFSSIIFAASVNI